MNRVAKAGILCTCVVLLAIGGAGAYNIVSALTDSTASNSASPASTTASGQPDGQAVTPPSAAAATALARSFLADWQAGPGRYADAADDTDSPSTAQSDLAGYRSGLGLTSIAFGPVASPGLSSTDPGARAVGFTVTARVNGGTWSYSDTLNVISDGGGRLSVDWASAALYPQLLAGQSLRAGQVPPRATGVTVLASNGTALTAAKDPSLTEAIADISQTATGGTTDVPGVEVIGADGAPAGTVKVFGSSSGPTVTTTIDAGFQAEAEKAVRLGTLDGLPSAVVVLDWRTGDILAVAFANTGAQGDTALLGMSPPGSTMKIITAAALFDDANLSPGSPAPCQTRQEAGGRWFTNDFSQAYPNANLETAFALSCNTAFVKDGYDALVHQTDTHLLGQEATDVFGLNGNWSIGGGVDTSNPAVPMDPDIGTAAADLIGQGDVEATPLAMASVAATVRDGAFHQPIILPNQHQVPAGQPLSPRTDADLQTLMDNDAHNPIGTAWAAMHQISDSGAKTGTAQVGPNGATTTNGWFAAYDNKIALAALVEGATTGGGSAGLIAQCLLTANQ